VHDLKYLPIEPSPKTNDKGDTRGISHSRLAPAESLALALGQAGAVLSLSLHPSEADWVAFLRGNETTDLNLIGGEGQEDDSLTAP